MRIHRTLFIKVKGIPYKITFGQATSQRNLDAAYRLRYQVYAKKDYIWAERYKDGREIDSFDIEKKCTTFIATASRIVAAGDTKTEEHPTVIGAIRLITSDPLPTEKYFTFTAPKEIAAIDPKHRAELGRFIIVPPDAKNGIYLPRGLVMLFLIDTLCAYGTHHNLKGGYAFIKHTLQQKMHRLRMPLNIIETYTTNYPKDGVLYKYFNQPADPVVPMYFITELFAAYTHKIITNGFIFKKVGKRDVEFRDTIIARFAFPWQKKKKQAGSATGKSTSTIKKTEQLSAAFWKKYFEVYDCLNELIPYKEVLEQIAHATRSTSGRKKGLKILDLGSGTGNVSLVIQKLDEGHDVHAIDASLEGVARHVEKHPEAKVRIGDITEPLPWADATFDVVVSNNTIYTIAPSLRPKLFSEISRILKPGGTLIISNLIHGFAPLTIYQSHLQRSLASKGLLRTIYDVLRLMVPTVRIFYYNMLIKKANTEGAYGFMKPGEQERLITEAGMQVLGPSRLTYADQAILTMGKK